jgi:hypothetical protein
VPIPQQLKNECFAAIQGAQLDPGDFFWADQTTEVQGGQATLILSFQPPRIITARFEFGYAQAEWRYHYIPDPEAPFGAGNAGSWDYEMDAFRRWLTAVRAEIGSPDLWGELRRERELLAQPNEARADGNTPFSPDELALISQQIAELKAYIVASLALSEPRVRELDARLDYLEQAAVRTGRVDWWNLFAGALLNLVLTGLIPPHTLQALLVLAAHGLTGLFGGGHSELVA